MERSSNAVTVSVLESPENSLPRLFKGFNSFKVEAGGLLDVETVLKLANVMGTPTRLRKELENKITPGLRLINYLEANRKISESDISYLLQCLEDRSIGLFGVRDKIDAVFQENLIAEDEDKENIENKLKVSADTGSRTFDETGWKAESDIIHTPRRRKSTKQQREVLSPSPRHTISIKHEDETGKTKMKIKYFDSMTSYGKCKKKPRMSAKKGKCEDH